MKHEGDCRGKVIRVENVTTITADGERIGQYWIYRKVWNGRSDL